MILELATPCCDESHQEHHVTRFFDDGEEWHRGILELLHHRESRPCRSCSSLALSLSVLQKEAQQGKAMLDSAPLAPASLRISRTVHKNFQASDVHELQLVAMDTVMKICEKGYSDLVHARDRKIWSRGWNRGGQSGIGREGCAYDTFLPLARFMTSYYLLYIQTQYLLVELLQGGPDASSSSYLPS